MQLRAFGGAGYGRLQQGNRRIELAGCAQDIGEIDHGFQPGGLQRQHLAIELLGGVAQTQRLGGIAQREQHLGVVRLGRQCLFILGDGFHMPSL